MSDPDIMNQSGASSSRSINLATEDDTSGLEDAKRDGLLKLKYHNDHLALVTADDPYKLIFDPTSISKLQNKESTTLKLKSPQDNVGKAFCYMPKPEYDWGRGLLMHSCITNVNNADDCEALEVTWNYDGTYLSTSIDSTPDGPYEWVLDVDFGKLVDRQEVNIVKEKDGNNKIGESEKGRAFILNIDGSISPRDEPNLFLGRRGDVISPDEMRFIELLHRPILDGDDDKAKNDISNWAANVNVNKVIKEFPTNILGMVCESDSRCGIVKLLLEDFEAKPNLEVDHPPLSIACFSGCKDIVKLLLQHKADPNNLNEIGTPPIASAALCGHVEIIQLLLNESNSDIQADINLGPNTAVRLSILNDHNECLKLLLQNGAEPSLDIEHPHVKDFPLQVACKKGIVKGLPLVTTILEHCGDLRIDRVEQLKDPASTDVLIKAYTTLSHKQLSRCISRALLKYDYDRKASRYPESENPLLACINLAKVVRARWRQVRRSDPNYCNALNSLFNNLQLGGAYILEEMYKDQDGFEWHGGSFVIFVIKSKEDHLSLFLNIESSRNAIQIAHKIQSRTFFNQPVVQHFINRNWYGTEAMQEIFLDQTKNNMASFMQKIGFVVLFFLNLVPILLQGTPLHPLLQLLPKSPIPMRCFCLKSKDPWIFRSPVVIFAVQCAFDLGLALMFTFINVNADATKLCINNDCNVRMNGIVPWLILFFTLGILTWEMRDLIVENLLATSRTKDYGFFGIFFDIPSAVRNYFRNDPFNFLDFPGALLASISLVLGLCGVSGSGIIVMQSFGCLFLWLRLLRVLTLHPTAGSLVQMFFKMVNMIVLWLFILMIIVMAFASSVHKLTFTSGIDPTYGHQYSSNEEVCESVSSKVMFKQFFEDAISGGGSALLDCKDTHGEFFGLYYGNLLTYGAILLCQVLLVNMLIAMMTEAFSTISDAQEVHFTYQRARHFLEIAGGKDWKPQHSIQVLYFPCGLFEVGMFCFKRFCYHPVSKEVKPVSEEVKPVSEELKPTGKRELDDEKLEEVTKIFHEYICEHQDEATDDDRWRLRLMKKVTDSKLEQDVKFDQMDKEHEKRFKELEFLVEDKFDKLFKLMEQAGS